jgi:hypothetical protein
MPPKIHLGELANFRYNLKFESKPKSLNRVERPLDARPNINLQNRESIDDLHTVDDKKAAIIHLYRP